MKGVKMSLMFAMLVCCTFRHGTFTDAQGVSMNELFTKNGNDDVPKFGASARTLRGLKFLVTEPDTILEYHNGPLLSATVTPVYIVWYGTFTDSLKATVRDFILSFNHTVAGTSTVGSWWNLTSQYKDAEGLGVTVDFNIAAEMDDGVCSLGKLLNDSDVEQLVLRGVNSTFAADAQALYVVLTADDIDVNDLCINSCAAHSATRPMTITQGKQLPYAWVADAEKQCPGKCAWPFAVAEYGPKTPALVPPNADVGTDGMIINLATILAGAATNPFGTGFYQGDGAAPLEAATACAGSFGQGSYSGYPGQLKKDQISGASFNSEGINGRRFLLPALWDAGTRLCTPP